MHTVWIRVSMAMIVALSATKSFAQTRGAASAVGVDDVLSAWRAYEAKVKEVTFEWDEDVALPDGSMNISTPGAAATAPPNEMRLKTHYLIASDKGRILIERRGEIWDASSNRPQAYERRSGIAKDVEGRVFTRLGGSPFNRGYVHNLKKNPERDVMNLKAANVLLPMLSFRATDPTLGPFARGAGAATILPGIEKIGAADCVILELKMPGDNGAKERYYLDIHNEYRIMRYVSIYNNSPTLWVDATEYRMKGGLWYPHEWSVVSVVSKKVVNTRCVATRFEPNRPIPGETFDVKFPPSTMVQDDSSGQRLRYAIDKNGKHRRITADEDRYATDRDIMNSESGRAKLRPHSDSPAAP